MPEEQRPADEQLIAELPQTHPGSEDALLSQESKRPSPNLPFLLSSFVGREREMDQIKRLLATTRLLTLTGPGGCGKTRLAVEVAADLAEHFGGDVRLVELASLSDPTLVAQSVAGVLGLREQPGRTLTESLVDYLRPRRLLLVLDNCEHLIAACAALAATLLHAAPELRILATSREALQVPGEALWVVPSLSLPDLHHLPSSERLLEYDAIRLFVDRVTETMPTFTLTAQNAQTVARLCHRLDGIPLALELAAARVRFLSLEQLLHRLEGNLHLLRGQSRTSLPRQQTLQATIEWSYALLTEQERLLFCRLAVFAGGFTLEAAESVCAGAGIAPEEVLEGLAQLVNKSLVVVIEQGEDPRYRLLETVRQYAQEKLAATAEALTVKTRHAHYFLALAEHAEPHLRSAGRAPWLERLEREHDNLRAALGWAREQGEAELGLRLAGTFSWFWYFRSYLSEARDWLASLLAVASAERRTPARALALFGAGAMAWTLGEYAASRVALTESVDIWREHPNKQQLAYSLTFLGLMDGLCGEYQAALAHHEESMALFREVGDRWGLGLMLYWLGDLFRQQRNHPAAQSRYEESLAAFREIGDQWGQATALQGLGAVAYRHHEYALARRHLEEALAFRREAGDRWLIAQTLNTLGMVALTEGDAQRAAAAIEESLALYRELGDKLGLIAALRSASAYAERQGNTERAEQLLTERMSLARALGRAREVAECMEALARLPARGHTVQGSLRLFALGPGRVVRGDYTLTSSDWGYAKVKELLFYLLSTRSRTKEQIGLAFWPDASPAQVRSYFHDTLYHLRQALGRPDWIRFERGSYVFNRSLDYWYDVEAFEAALAQAHQHQASAPDQAIQALEDALRLYQGDFLEDALAGEWHLLPRENLRRNYLEALLLLGRLHVTQGHDVQAADTYRQAIAHDRYLEAAHRELMRCYARLGERGQALRHYQTLVEWMRDELGAPPAPETTALFERLQRGENL
jgi:predicted ATPase/DNA-binding SARP family transcriptional activator